MGQAKTMLRVRERKMAMRINAWMRDWRAGHSYRGEGPVEENQDSLQSHVEVQRGDADRPDNEHRAGETTEGWKPELDRRMKPE